MSDETCDAEVAGYDGMFGVYCSLPVGHGGMHKDAPPGDPDSEFSVWWTMQRENPVVTLEAVARRLLEGWEPEEAYESLIWSRRRDPDEFEPMSPSEVELIEALRGKG